MSPPNIIFWNVRADTYGYPAAADQKGVMLLSGYSPALMKFILSGEMEEEVAEALDDDGNVVKTRRQVDPREALRRVLNDSGLDAVRTVLDAMPDQSWGTLIRLKQSWGAENCFARRVCFVYHLPRSISL